MCFPPAIGNEPKTARQGSPMLRHPDFTSVTYSTYYYKASPQRGQTLSLDPFSITHSAMVGDPLKLFGLHLAELRKQRGWSQEKLALESGMARSYLSGIERGVRNVSLINICAL